VSALIQAILTASLSAVAGAAEPSIELRRIEAHPPFWGPERLTPLGDALVFEASSDPTGEGFSSPGVWITDGTTAGTRRLVFPRTHPHIGQRLLGAAGRRVFVQAVSSGRRGGDEIHAQDVHTGASERILAGFASLATASNDELFFSAQTFSAGRGLYRSDGTARGTRRLRSGALVDDFLALPSGLLYEAPVSGDFGIFFAKAKSTQLLTTLPSDTFFTRVGARAFFPSRREESEDLWSSDGTPEGTVIVASPNPASFLDIYPCLGRALLLNTKGSGANEAWVSDGTPLGTAPFATLPKVVYPHFAVADTGATCMFKVAGEAPGGLWKTDLTPEGTQRVADLYLSLIQEPATGGSNVAFFSAFDGDHGAEPWISDGTPEGTHELADLVPGINGSLPADFRTVGPRVFWSASSEHFGSDLWMAESAPTLSIEDVQVAEKGRPVPCSSRSASHIGQQRR
jgi:ELWxxDGT repeat protein